MDVYFIRSRKEGLISYVSLQFEEVGKSRTLPGEGPKNTSRTEPSYKGKRYDVM